MVGFFIALDIIALATALAVQLTEALGLTNEEPVAAGPERGEGPTPRIAALPFDC
jgi:hypothetical protein